MAHIAFGFLGLLALIANTTEYFFYPNFLYSHFHFSPGQANTALGLASLVICFLARKQIKATRLGLVIIMLCSYAFFFHIPDALGRILGKTGQSISQIGYSDVDKMRLVWGGSIDFFNFLSKEIPETSSVLLPPETLPWRYTGSTQFLGPWLFPRQVRTVSVPYYKNHFQDFDYIVISSEEDGANAHIWPDFKVEADQIKIFGWGKTPDEIISGQNWDPDQWQNKKPWGLITVKSKQHD